MAAERSFRFGLVAGQARSGEDWIAKARRAESLGFSVWLMPDTLGYSFAPIPALATIAAATNTLHIGTYVLANDMRNPVLVAKDAATLDFLSNGRFELGLGVGRPGIEEDYHQIGLPIDAAGVRVARLSEALSIIKTLFAGQQATVTGEHYSVVGAKLFPTPTQQPRLPIMIAASGKRMLALAAREADIVALGVRPDSNEATIAEMIGVVNEAAGERRDAIELNANIIAAGQQVAAWIQARHGSNLAEWQRAGSVSLLMGTVDEMCDQLQRRRETLGISYITMSEELMEGVAPVVERLAGR